ncbi:hypothetical protein C8R46DRAFT_1212490 [Mycena filopes]|nr:hypothetical protein C8R46DRAFT_1212490 [Mycena filopes]
MAGLDVADPRYSGYYGQIVSAAPGFAQVLRPPASVFYQQVPANLVAAYAAPGAPQQRPNDGLCFFCKAPGCFIGTCPTSKAYIQAGRITIVDEWHRYADGTRIRGNPNGLKAEVDARYGGPLPAVLAVAQTYHLHVAPDVQSLAVIVDREGEDEAGAVSRSMDGDEKDEVIRRLIAAAVTRGAKERDEAAARVEIVAVPEEKAVSETPHAKDAQRTGAYYNQSKAATTILDAARSIHARVLETIVPVPYGELLAISPDLRKQAVEHSRVNRVPNDPKMALTSFLSSLSPDTDVPVQHSTLLRECVVVVNGKQEELGLLDDGSEIVVIRDDLFRELNLLVNKRYALNMQTVSDVVSLLPGCVERLLLVVGRVRTWARAYVVPNAPYRVLLGRPWQNQVLLAKEETADGEATPVASLVTLTREFVTKDWPVQVRRHAYEMEGVELPQNESDENFVGTWDDLLMFEDSDTGTRVSSDQFLACL